MGEYSNFKCKEVKELSLVRVKNIVEPETGVQAF